jgi:ABC-type branched-subunit amino acid transport system substrate-binding protein
VIHVPGAYGEGLGGAFSHWFTQLGGTVLIDKPYALSQLSYTALLSEVYAAGRPDAILLVAYTTDGAQIVRDYDSDFSGQQTFWYFTDAVEDVGFVTAVGANNFTFQHEGTGPATSAPGYAAFRAAFRGRYARDPNPGNFPANVYDAVYLTALAMAAAGMTDSPSVRDNLRAVSEGGTVYEATDYAAAAAAARAGMDINYEGASGPVDLDENGDVTATYDVWKAAGTGIGIVEQSVSP